MPLYVLFAYTPCVCFYVCAYVSTRIPILVFLSLYTYMYTPNVLLYMIIGICKWNYRLLYMLIVIDKWIYILLYMTLAI